MHLNRINQIDDDFIICRYGNGFKLVRPVKDICANQPIVSNENSYLSRQQLACAKRLIAGLTVKEIAARLNLSPRTVESYFDNMKHKLKCGNRTELILKLSEIIN